MAELRAREGIDWVELQAQLAELRAREGIHARARREQMRAERGHAGVPGERGRASAAGRVTHVNQLLRWEIPAKYGSSLGPRLKYSGEYPRSLAQGLRFSAPQSPLTWQLPSNVCHADCASGAVHCLMLCPSPAY
jgi:hypothetical protein